MSLIPTKRRCGISHWQNFGLLIFAKFGLPVSLFHCLETEKCYCFKPVHQCRGFGHQVPFKETLFPDYCIVRKVQSDGAMKDVMPFDRILKVNAVSCKASALAKMMCLFGRFDLEGWVLGYQDRLEGPGGSRSKDRFFPLGERGVCEVWTCWNHRNHRSMDAAI